MLHHVDELLLPGGFLGVDLFFVLSGFLITRILLVEQLETGGIRLVRFYARRALRLLPALVGLLAAVLVFSAIVLGPYLLRQNARAAGIVLLYAMNWARAFSLHPKGILMHTWSLSIEEQFYLLWPLGLVVLLKFVSSRRGLVAAALALAGASTVDRACLLLSGASLERVYNGLDAHASGLLLGCAVGVAWLVGPREASGRILREEFLRVAGLLSLAGLVLLYLVAQWSLRATHLWQLTAAELLSAVLVVAAFGSRGGILGTLLGSRPLTYTGRISYGLYLWHFPIFFVLSAAGFASPAVFLLGMPLSFGIASASFFVLERPFLRLKARLGSRP